MQAVDWFERILAGEFNIKVNKQDVGHEATELYRDEIDPDMLPFSILRDCPDALVFETMLYVDEEAIDWIGAIAIDMKKRRECFRMICKSGNPVLVKISAV